MIPTATTSTTNTTTTCPVTTVANAGTGTIMVGPSSTDCNHLGDELEYPCFSECYLNLLDVTQKVFDKCLSKRDFTDIMALACTNVTISNNIKYLADSIDLLQLCPGLRILDAKTQGFTACNEPNINKLKASKYFWKLAPYVEGGAGLTLALKIQGMTPNKWLEIAANGEYKVTVEFSDPKILKQHGEVAVKDTCWFWITNAPVTETRCEFYDAQEKRVPEAGFDGLPSLGEYLLLLIVTQKISKLQICLFGKNPLTFGRSSTHVGTCPLAVRNLEPGLLCVTADYLSFASDARCAGGSKNL